MSSSGWFAPLDEEDRQHLISSVISVGLGITATSVGLPWLMFAAAPLDLLAKRASQMWVGANNRPTYAFAVGGRQSEVKYQPDSGVKVNAVSLLGYDTDKTRKIAGQFDTSLFAGQGLRRGDPVALVINSTTWSSSNNGLVVPARFGEPFRIRLPKGDYSISAYSLDTVQQQLVDPVTAIGAKYLRRGVQMSTPMLLRERQSPMTPALLADLRRQQTSVRSARCPHCGNILYVSFLTCPRCGNLIASDAKATQEHRDSFDQILKSFAGSSRFKADPGKPQLSSQRSATEWAELQGPRPLKEVGWQPQPASQRPIGWWADLQRMLEGLGWRPRPFSQQPSAEPTELQQALGGLTRCWKCGSFYSPIYKNCTYCKAINLEKLS